MRRHLALVIVASALAVTALAGCSSAVSSDEVATQVTAALAKSQNVPVDQMPKITCPDDLDATVGATGTCVLFDDSTNKSYDVAVKVTNVEDGTATFDVQVATTPRP